MTNADLGKLVTRIRGGDSAAFMELYENTYRSVFFHANTILKNKEDVEDAVQDAYEQAYMNLDRLQNPEAVGGWLNRIVSNISLNKANSQKTKKRLFHRRRGFLPRARGGRAGDARCHRGKAGRPRAARRQDRGPPRRPARRGRHVLL